MSQVADLVGTDSAATLGDAVRRMPNETTGSGGALVLGLLTLLLRCHGRFRSVAGSPQHDMGGPTEEGRRNLAARSVPFAFVRHDPRHGIPASGLPRGSAAIGALVDTTSNIDWMAPYIASLDVAASLVVITSLFALIFKLLPDTKIEWRDVWVGAALTAGLFVVGKFAIGFYLGVSDVGSAYGAAGSVIVILVWIYYSALILFFGAEFTQVWASNRAQESSPGSPANATVSNRPTHAGERTKEPPWLMVAAAVILAWVASKVPEGSGQPQIEIDQMTSIARVHRPTAAQSSSCATGQVLTTFL